MNQKKDGERVMVLLVGGRLTPNFIGVLGYKPTIIECLVSENEQGKYYDVLEVLSPLPNVKLPTQPRLVPAFDMARIMHACQQVVESHPGKEVVFNVTCATKVMALAAYEVAKQAKQPAIYVDTTHGRFLNLTQPSEQPIPIRVGLEDYLGFYGRQPRETFDFGKLSLSEDDAIAASIYMAEAGIATAETLALMRQYSRGKGRRTVRIQLRHPLESDQGEILRELNRLGLISNLEGDSEQEISYLIARDADWNFMNGTWLEVYAWHQASQCLDEQGRPLFDECGFSFEIPGPEGARKEIDVGCMFQGQLLHCSCKSEQNPFRTRHLDELRAVSSLLGGRFCSRLFVTNVYPPAEESGGWRDYQLFAQQAKDREVVLVTGEELGAIGSILKREAVKPTFWRI